MFYWCSRMLTGDKCLTIDIFARVFYFGCQKRPTISLMESRVKWPPSEAAHQFRLLRYYRYQCDSSHCAGGGILLQLFYWPLLVGPSVVRISTSASDSRANTMNSSSRLVVVSSCPWDIRAPFFPHYFAVTLPSLMERTYVPFSHSLGLVFGLSHHSWKADTVSLGTFWCTYGAISLSSFLPIGKFLRYFAIWPFWSSLTAFPLFKDSLYSDFLAPMLISLVRKYCFAHALGRKHLGCLVFLMPCLYTFTMVIIARVLDFPLPGYALSRRLNLCISPF